MTSCVIRDHGTALHTKAFVMPATKHAQSTISRADAYLPEAPPWSIETLLALAHALGPTSSWRSTQPWETSTSTSTLLPLLKGYSVPWHCSPRARDLDMQQ